MTSDKTVHSGYNPSTVANDIAVLHFPSPVMYTGEYPAQCCVCVVRPHVIGSTTLWLLHILGVDANMIDSVTHSDKVIITKGGQ